MDLRPTVEINKSASFSLSTDQNYFSQVAFIDTSIADWKTLADGVPAGIEVVLLDGRQDGLTQISAYLATRQPASLDAIHVLSHGAVGQLNLGSTSLTQDTLGQYTTAFNTIGQALSEQGDLLLYGCDVGASEAGQALVHSIAAMTHADVAASDNLTGAATLGGDWALETHAGVINAASLAVDNYTGTLAVVSFTGDAGNTNAPNATVAMGTPKSSVAITNTATSDTLNIAINGGTGVYQDTTTVFTGLGMSMPTGSSGMVVITAENTDINSVTLTVQGGKVFDFVSLLMMEAGGVAETFTFTPNGNVANKVTHTFAGGLTQTVDLSANTNFDNLTSLTISSNDSAFQINFDDIQLENIGGANAAPVFSSGASGSVAENAAPTTVVYNAIAADDDPITYSLTGTDAASFTINATTGQVRLVASADYETKSSYSITVNAADASHTASPTTKNVTINVTNVNEAPTNVALSASSVAENTSTASAVTIGSLSSTDPDASNTFTYSVVGGADQSSFQVSSGSLQFVAGSTLNYEAKSSYAVTVRSTDQGGLTYDKALTVNLSDVNEAPTVANAIGSRSASVSQAFSYQFASNTFADVDAGQTLTYAATKGDGSALPSWLSFNAATRTFSGTPAIGDVATVAVKVTATDNGTGTLSVSDTFDLVVSNGPAVSSINRADTETVLKNATSVDYTVTFSQAVTGVDLSDFTLSSTGNAAGTISSISGSGTTLYRDSGYDHRRRHLTPRSQIKRHRHPK